MTPDDNMSESEYLDSLDMPSAESGDGTFVLFPNAHREEARTLLGRTMASRRLAEDSRRIKQAETIAREKRGNLYVTAKAAKKGETCTCPGCGKPFEKKSYQQAFCSNKGRGNCKDTYWNRATPERTERAKSRLDID